MYLKCVLFSFTDLYGLSLEPCNLKQNNTNFLHLIYKIGKSYLSYIYKFVLKQTECTCNVHLFALNTMKLFLFFLIFMFNYKNKEQYK